MKFNRSFVFSSSIFAASLASSAAQGVTLQSLGYALGTKKPLPSTFADDMKKGTKLTQDQVGCTWASRPNIYVFDDVIVFVADGGTDYNTYPTATALSKGCWLPPAIAKKSGYTGLMPAPFGRRAVSEVGYSTTTLAASGMPVPGDNSPVAGAVPPPNFKKILENGVQVTQRQLGCTFAGLPFIYAFADGVVFTDSTGSTYNSYSLNDVQSKNRCWMPSSLMEGGPGDTDMNTNGETEKEEMTTNYIDTHNAQQLCLGRWRWTERWDEGYYQTNVCTETLVPYKVNVVDVDKGNADGFPGVTKSLSTQVLTEDLGISEATTRTTDSGSASINNDAKTLQECWDRVSEWARNKSFGRTVVNGFVVRDDPKYAGLFQIKPINVVENKVVSNSPVTQGAKCTDTKLGGVCVAYTNKRHCQVNYQNDYYTVNYHEETLYNKVKDDPNCKPSTDFISVPKSSAGQSKLNVTSGQILGMDASFVEVTSNKPRYDYQCSSGVHLRDIGPKYEYLNKYINDNKNKPGIATDPEFIAAVSTFWALLVEKSDKVVDTDAMGLINIENVHKLFPTAVFMGHSDADLGIEEDAM